MQWLLILACLYVALVLVLVAVENWLVYLAEPASSSWSAPAKLAVEDIELHSADGTALHAWWCPTEGAEGALLYCHGQRGNLSHRTWMIRRFQQQLNVSVLIFDYPGYGKSEGEPSEAGCHAAAEAAYDWLTREKKVPAEEVVLFGKSLGGGVAVHLATRRPHRALVLAQAFTSLPDVVQRFVPIVPARLLMRNRFDNLAKIAGCRGPVFLCHGADDWKIPPSHSRRLYAAAPEPKRLVLMEGVGHGWPFITHDCMGELRDFLDEAAPARSGAIGSQQHEVRGDGESGPAIPRPWLA